VRLSTHGRCGIALIAVAAAAAVAQPAAAATATPNDPYFASGDQWGLSGYPASIGAPSAWAVSTGAGTLVADVDTGADLGHPDLAGKLVAGARFTDCNGQPSSGSVADDVGHGSMTTGIMAARTNNGQGIAAVAPDAAALIIKVLVRSGEDRGQGCDADVAAGIRYAVDHGAQVINVSIGAEIPLTGTSLLGSQIPAAVRDAAARGAAVALAAGNNSLPLTDYAEVSRVALVVGALGPDGSVAYYSTSGNGVNVYAPGGDDRQSGAGPNAHGLVLSTYRNGAYRAGQGTSFAAPHAAGTLALLMSCGLNAAQARQRILDTAQSGRLNAAAAVSGAGRCGPAGAPTGGGGAPGSVGSPPRAASSSPPGAPGGGGVPDPGAAPVGGAPVPGAVAGTPGPGVLSLSGGGNVAAGAAAPDADAAASETAATAARSPQRAVAIGALAGGIVCIAVLAGRLLRSARRARRRV
jgi:serine protease